MEYSEKQIQIMEAAEKLFAAKGFNGTSVRDISEAAGVNLAMVSYYFGSKEKLFEAMFAHRSEFFKLPLALPSCWQPGSLQRYLELHGRSPTGSLPVSHHAEQNQCRQL